MIDNFTILFTTMLTVYVVWRASRLDKIIPWFETAPTAEDAAPKPPRRDFRIDPGMLPPTLPHRPGASGR